MGTVKVAIVGVGNCAASLVQGVHYYRNADESASVPGLMHVRFGEYHVSDIEFVAAFDVDAKKVGRDLSEAIVASENNTIKICDVPPLGVAVQRGTTLDGLGKYYRELVDESDEQPVDMVAALRESGADVLVCYLPVGSQQAAEFYAQAAIDAGVAFVNALPVFIAGTKAWADKFTAAGVPIVGDDIKSQVGATITHRVLAKLFEDRGVQLDRTMQLNVGGNMDFKNMLERERLESKKISKTQSVTSQIDRDMGAGNVHIGPSDHVPWLSDRKWAYVRLEGRAFGDVPLSLEYKLEVWDSPNSAGIIIDAVRAAKIALDRGIGGPILSASLVLHEEPARAVRRQPGPRRRRGLHPRRRRPLSNPPHHDSPHPRPLRCTSTGGGGGEARQAATISRTAVARSSSLQAVRMSSVITASTPSSATHCRSERPLTVQSATDRPSSRAVPTASGVRRRAISGRCTSSCPPSWARRTTSAAASDLPPRSAVRTGRSAHAARIIASSSASKDETVMAALPAEVRRTSARTDAVRAATAASVTGLASTTT